MMVKGGGLIFFILLRNARQEPVYTTERELMAV